jgi:hypothetical protein
VRILLVLFVCLLLPVASSAQTGPTAGPLLKPLRGSHAERLQRVLRHPSIQRATIYTPEERRTTTRVEIALAWKQGMRGSRDVALKRQVQGAFDELWTALRRDGVPMPIAKPTLTPVRIGSTASGGDRIFVARSDIQMIHNLARAVAAAPPGDQQALLKNLAYVAHGKAERLASPSGRRDRARYREALRVATMLLLGHELAHSVAALPKPQNVDPPLDDAPGLVRLLKRAVGKRAAARMPIGVLYGDGTVAASPALEVLKHQAHEFDADHLAALFLTRLPRTRNLDAATAYLLLTDMRERVYSPWKPEAEHPSNARRFDDFRRVLHRQGVRTWASDVTRPQIRRALLEVERELRPSKR